MNLHTKRLLLVPLGQQFLLSTHGYTSDLENTKYMVHLPNVDIEETKSFIDNVQAEWQKENPSFYEFAILLNNKHIGAASIYLDGVTSTGELGWIIDKHYWGNGYATEAAREIINFAWKKLQVKRVIAHCDSENIGSYKVMEKIGLSFIDKSQGRRNKSSDEDREELTYVLELTSFNTK